MDQGGKNNADGPKRRKTEVDQGDQDTGMNEPEPIDLSDMDSSADDENTYGEHKAAREEGKNQWKNAPKVIKDAYEGAASERYTKYFWDRKASKAQVEKAKEKFEGEIQDVCRENNLEYRSWMPKFKTLEEMKELLKAKLLAIRKAPKEQNKEQWADYHETLERQNEVFKYWPKFYKIPEDLAARYGIKQAVPDRKEKEPAKKKVTMPDDPKEKRKKPDDPDDPKEDRGYSSDGSISSLGDSDRESISGEDDYEGIYFDPKANDDFMDLKKSSSGRKLKDAQPLLWSALSNGYEVLVASGKEKVDRRFRLEKASYSRFGAAFFQDKSKNIRAKSRGDLRNDDKSYKYTGDDIHKPVGVAWIDGGRATDCPLVSIQPKTKHEKYTYPHTRVGVKWKDRVVTWETRSDFKRLWGAATADEVIYKLAGIREARYNDLHGLPPIENLFDNDDDSDDDMMTTITSRTGRSQRSTRTTRTNRSNATRRSNRTERSNATRRSNTTERSNATRRSTRSRGEQQRSRSDEPPITADMMEKLNRLTMEVKQLKREKKLREAKQSKASQPTTGSSTDTES
jgi:hypothetical protein